MTSLLRRPASVMGSMANRRLTRTPQSSILHGDERLAACRPHLQLNRSFCRPSAARSFSTKETVTITYIDPSGEEHPVEAEVGKHLLDVAHDNNIELEGACGGELACSTCHLVFEQEVYDTLPPMSDEEEDMLDLAFELTETSRLGCQIRVTKEFEGVKVRMPDDGY
mmetsp:Transcript_37470/g.79975  ORF Transcript_37470/g.79975 Transcript_37470/m.79975 type:complete len:167 (-) Transcript_37470:476-976(-)|eukprot:CAMPEP_0172535600 /NCGR_PEP_ID=MMETSP1067-20121228/7534_1 /TAXON_ID=265564 ORGANISM="Thalassiosira punctigera, Strain Tpunct2005C2" /NCGR_SAMPLE_ID=MMETSP1067 /ASSEMBLY_ACC=CAM_ASM_000444 /LENGTH=166 /DNA_ID=CAMNT_0013320539 /DNA_START=76 /DNA_END=576 /DNA_ORIENTATION=-